MMECYELSATEKIDTYKYLHFYFKVLIVHRTIIQNIISFKKKCIEDIISCYIHNLNINNALLISLSPNALKKSNKLSNFGQNTLNNIRAHQTICILPYSVRRTKEINMVMFNTKAKYKFWKN